MVAALGNAMERVGERDPVIVLWINDNDNVNYEQSGMAAMTGEDP